MLNTEKLSEEVLNNIRESLGLEPGDISKDDEINKMNNDDLFNMWCEWNGLIDGKDIKDVVEEIYGVELHL